MAFTKAIGHCIPQFLEKSFLGEIMLNIYKYIGYKSHPNFQNIKAALE